MCECANGYIFKDSYRYVSFYFTSQVICLFDCLSEFRFVCLSIDLTVCLYVWWSIWLTFGQSIYLYLQNLKRLHIMPFSGSVQSLQVPQRTRLCRSVEASRAYRFHKEQDDRWMRLNSRPKILLFLASKTEHKLLPVHFIIVLGNYLSHESYNNFWGIETWVN